jgi:transcription elongation factor GreA
MLITADIGGNEIKFLLGSREIAQVDPDNKDFDVYSEKSPLGSAVLGKKIGETVKYKAPNGKEIQVAILEAAYLF